MNKRGEEFLDCLGNGKTEHELNSELEELYNDPEWNEIDDVKKLEERREKGREYKKKWRKENPEENYKQRKKYKQSECGKAANGKYQKKYRNIPENIIKAKEYQQKPEVKEKQKKYNKKPEVKERISKYQKEYIKDEKNRKKLIRRTKDYRELRDKLIKDYGGCQDCNSKDNLEMHHEDYEEGGVVLLLCKKCHWHLHMKIKRRSK